MRLFGREREAAHVAGGAVAVLALLAALVAWILSGGATKPAAVAATEPPDLIDYTVAHALAEADTVVAHIPRQGWVLVEGARGRHGLGFRTWNAQAPQGPLHYTHLSPEFFSRTAEHSAERDEPLVVGFDPSGAFTAFWSGFSSTEFDLTEIAAAGQPVAVSMETVANSALGVRLAEVGTEGEAQVFVTPLGEEDFVRTGYTPWMWTCPDAGFGLGGAIEAEIRTTLGPLAEDIEVQIFPLDRGPTRMEVTGPEIRQIPRRVVDVPFQGKRELPEDLYCPARVPMTVSCLDAAACDALVAVDFAGITAPYRDEDVLEEAIARSTRAGMLRTPHASRAELLEAATVWTETQVGLTHLTIVRPVP